MGELGWGEPAAEDPVLEVENGQRITCAGVELLQWDDADDPITAVGQNRTTWADHLIEAFCFTTRAGNVLLAIRPPEAAAPDRREVRRLPLMVPAERAELVVDNTAVRLVVDVGAPDGEPFLGYDIQCIDAPTIRLEFHRRSDGPPVWPGRSAGSAALVANAGRVQRETDNTRENVKDEEPTPDWHHVVLEVFDDGDFFADSGPVDPMSGRQWSAGLRLPPTEEQVHMPGVGAKLERLWRKHDLQQVIARIIDLVKVTDHHLFIVGGSVRDAVLGIGQPKDLDLAGDIPPSMFRFWVRSIAAELDMNLLTDTSPTNVTRIYRRARDEPSAIEYALLKHDLKGDVWTGCNDLYTDYRTRDLAENSLFYSLTTNRILTASPELPKWLDGGAGPEGPQIDPKKYGQKLTVITTENGELHEGLGPWASANLLARLMKSYARFLKGKQRPDTHDTAISIGRLCPQIERQVAKVAQTMGVAPADILAAAMLEACSDSLGYRQQAAEWLRDTLADAARRDDYQGPLVKEWFPRAITLACGSAGSEPEWQAPVDLRGKGLAKAVNDGKRWTVDPAGLRLLTWFTPEQVSLKLGAIVSCWEQVVLPMRRDDKEIKARAYRNPADGSYLVEVDILDNQPIEAPTVPTGSEAHD